MNQRQAENETPPPSCFHEMVVTGIQTVFAARGRSHKTDVTRKKPYLRVLQSEPRSSADRGTLGPPPAAEWLQ